MANIHFAFVYFNSANKFILRRDITKNYLVLSLIQKS